MTPSACVMIRRCAGLLAARRLKAVRLRRVRWAASRRNGSRHPRTSLLLPICPASGSTLCSVAGLSRIYFRADAAFAMPEVYEFLEAERIKYAIRLPANRILQDRIGYLLKRPVGRPPIEIRRFYANFHYQAASWKIPRRVIAKVEWHPGELVPRIGFVVTNLSRLAERPASIAAQSRPDGAAAEVALRQVVTPGNGVGPGDRALRAFQLAHPLRQPDAGT